MPGPGRYLAVSFVTLLIIAIIGTGWLRKSRARKLAARAEAAEKHQRATQRSTRRLDVAAFREDIARRKAKADALRVRDAARPHAPYVPQAGKGFGASMTSPSCILGPGELCTALADVIAACDGGDGASCLAVGQYLQDTPPRPLIANAFFITGCKFGDQLACARRDEIGNGPAKTCEEDLLACAWRANLAGDEVVLDQACVAGVADACAVLVAKVDEPALKRQYLEESCQLGNPMACTALGAKLRPGCTEECFPPDPEQAAAALAIGCAAGWADACK